MRNILTAHGIPDTGFVCDAVEAIEKMPQCDAKEFLDEFNLTPVPADIKTFAFSAAAAIVQGATTVEQVVQYVASRVTGLPAVNLSPSIGYVVSKDPTPFVGDYHAMKAHQHKFRTYRVEGGEPMLFEGAVDNSVDNDVDNSDDIDGEVIAVDKPKGKAGRKRGKSVFCKAVAIIEANPKADRETLLKLIMDSGVGKSSAQVYLWRYNKGERQ